jgi:exosortase
MTVVNAITPSTIVGFFEQSTGQLTSAKLTGTLDKIDPMIASQQTAPVSSHPGHSIRPAHLVVLGLLLLVCYWPALKVSAMFLLFSDDMAHGLAAPIVAGYIAWSKRTILSSGSLAPSLSFIPVLLAGSLIAIVGTIGASTTFERFGLLISLAGCLLLFGGFAGLRCFLFPLLLLLFTFPIPAVLYGEVTLPLQLLASRLAELSFEGLGYSVIRDGNILELAHLRLSVAEACSGIRSLVTLAFFCVVYGYFLENRRWLQLLIVAASVPAAIFMNVIRILLAGILGAGNPAWIHGTLHDTLGWAAFCLGFGLVFLLHRVCLYWLSPRHA